MPTPTVCVTLNRPCLLFTSFKHLLCQSQTRRGLQMVSIFEVQEAALRSGKILLLPMTASPPSTSAALLSYVLLCSFEEACQNVLQPTIKTLFFSKVTLFFSFSIVKIQNLSLLPNPSSSCTHSLLIQLRREQELKKCFDATDS